MEMTLLGTIEMQVAKHDTAQWQQILLKMAIVSLCLFLFLAITYTLLVQKLVVVSALLVGKFSLLF
jgi:hypothetical protein